MSGTSPASVLFSSDGYEVAVVNGATTPTGTRAITLAGSDGTNSRFISTDTSGRITIVGPGTAGTPVGGVVTIQGIASGTPIPISGSVTATNAAVSTTGSAPPASASYTGGNVTTAAPTYTNATMNALSLTTGGLLRIDGSGVTQPVSGTVTANIGTTGGLALDATLAKLTIAQSTALGSNTQAMVGGSVTTAAPTYTTGNINPLSLTTAGALRIDGSAVTQPVSGTVTANAGTGNFTVVQATASNLNATVVQTTAANLNATVVGTTAAGSGASSGLVTVQGNASGTPIPVSGTVTANNASVSATGSAPPASATYIGGSVTTAAPAYTTGQMSALSLTTTGLLRIDGSGVTQPVSGTVTATQATAANLRTQTSAESATGSAPPANAGLIGGSVTTAAPTYTTGQMSALSLTTGGALRIDGSGTTQPISGTVTSNQGTANSLANAWSTKITDATNGPVAVKAASTAPVAADPALVVALSPNTPTLSVIVDKSSTGTITSVAGSTSNTSVLATNANRVSATVYNATNKTMYIALGATASTSSYTIQVFQGSYWELPVSYTGAISAVWASGVSGNALITELT